MVRWVMSFLMLALALLIAAFGPPLAIGVAAAVTREPLLGLITGLIGMFALFKGLEVLESASARAIRPEE